jgi:hypothetical protein
MIDAHLRATERRALQDTTPQAREAEILARLRAGGRDPRRRPAAGDLVQNRFDQQRIVVDVWPKIVTADVGPRGGRILRGALVERLEMRAGGEWMFLALRVRGSTSWNRQGDEHVWEVGIAGFRDLPSVPGCIWTILPGRFANDMAAALEDRGEDAPTVVEFAHAQDRARRAGPIESRPLGVWRKWAREGRVLELGT